MRIWKFISLFRELFGEGRKLEIKRIEKCGLLAVKIAQMYAVRSDVLSPEKCRKLQSLYEEVTPIGWTEVKAVIDQDAPEGFWESVSQIDTGPLATASLGQVHRGVLVDKSEVVIKVVKPEAIEEFEKDLKAVRIVLRSVLLFYPKLRRLADPLGTLTTIERLTRHELNLRNEQGGTKRLIKLQQEGLSQGLTHLSTLEFPHIYQELCTTTVSVSQYLPCRSVRQGLKEGVFDYQQLLALFRIHGYFLFYKGQFHGDLHPGNIFYEGQNFWFIDNANLEEVDPHFARGLLRFLVRLGKRDFAGAARVMESLAVEPLPDHRRFIRRFERLYANFEGSTSSLTTQMMESVKLCVHSGLEFPEGAFPLIKSLMYLDGMALECAPEAPLLQDVLQFASDFDGLQ